MPSNNNREFNINLSKLDVGGGITANLVWVSNSAPTDPSYVFWLDTDFNFDTAIGDTAYGHMWLLKIKWSVDLGSGPQTVWGPLRPAFWLCHDDR